jgi:hypothetical protein
MTEERRQDQSFFFSLARYKTKAITSKMCPGDDVSCSSVTKHDRKKGPGTKIVFVSAGRLQDRKLQTRKLSWIRVPVKMFGLGIIIYSCDIQRQLSNYQACDTLSDSED